MPRPLAPLLLVAATGAVLLALAGGLAALAGWAGGAAAVLLAARRSPPAPPSARPAPDLAEVLDAVAQAILITDHGRVVAANRAALGLLGRHIVGQDARLAVRHPDAAAVLAPAADGSVPPPPAEPVLLYGPGALDQLWEMRVAAAGPDRRVVTFADHSQARAADRMRTDFVANASHELRTPLASILGYVETLQGEAGEEPRLRARFLGTVLDEARRMQRLVQDLLSLSRIEADRFRQPAGQVDLAALVRAVAAEIAAAGAGPALALDLAEPLPPVTGDAAQLSQLLHNLVGNARAYGRPDAPVTVAAAPDGAQVRLSVADQGEGIAAEHLPRLTERFYRVPGGRRAAGTGLGLAIVKHIVERHRGRLLIESRLGAGTTVTAWLPAAPADAAAGAAAVTES